MLGPWHGWNWKEGTPEARIELPIAEGGEH